MALNEAKIIKILKDGSYVSESDLKAARKSSKDSRSTIIQQLFTQGLITKDLLGQAISEYYDISYADLNTNVPDREQVLKIPEKIAKKYKIVVYEEGDDYIQIATSKPEVSGLKEKLEEVFQKKVKLFYSLEEDVEVLFRHYQKSLEERFEKILKSEEGVPKLVEEILREAYSKSASDIHLEPRKDDVLIRYRIDGVLQDVGVMPSEYYVNVLNRLKVMAHLRIDEHFAAQDGSIRHKHKGNLMDLRISVVPTVDGEKVAIRILSKYVQDIGLEDLGLTGENVKTVTKNSKKPFGMIIVAGPTGSGKTTTLYAVLRTLNSPRVNITTIEDPVEYRVGGINQIQINPETDLTFAKG